MYGIGHGHGEGNQFRPPLDMSDGNSNVAAPDVNNRRTATIIVGIHALIVILPKLGVQR